MRELTNRLGSWAKLPNRLGSWAKLPNTAKRAEYCRIPLKVPNTAEYCRIAPIPGQLHQFLSNCTNSPLFAPILRYLQHLLQFSAICTNCTRAGHKAPGQAIRHQGRSRTGYGTRAGLERDMAPGQATEQAMAPGQATEQAMAPGPHYR